MPTPRSYASSAARYLVILSAILFSFPTGTFAQKLKDLKPQGYVNDFANVLSASAKQKLTALCAEVDTKAGAQITVVTVSSLAFYSCQAATFPNGVGCVEKAGRELPGLPPTSRVASLKRDSEEAARPGPPPFLSPGSGWRDRLC